MADISKLLKRTHLILTFDQDISVFNFLSLCSDLSIPIRSFNENTNEVGIDFMDFLLNKNREKFRSLLIENTIRLHESTYKSSLPRHKYYCSKRIEDFSSGYTIDFSSSSVITPLYGRLLFYSLGWFLVSIFGSMLRGYSKPHGNDYSTKVLFRRGYFTDPRSTFCIETLRYDSEEMEMFERNCEQYFYSSVQMVKFIKDYYENLEP